MMGLTMLSVIVTFVKATYLHLLTDHTDPRQCHCSLCLHQMLIFCSLQCHSISSLGPVSNVKLSLLAHVRLQFHLSLT